MDPMQEKLLRFRKQKEREQKIALIKNKVKQFLMPFSINKEVAIDQEDKKEKMSESRKSVESDTLSTVSEGEECALSSGDEEVQTRTTVAEAPDSLQYLLRTMYVLLWLTVYMIAIELQFGIVYLMFSALLGIYFNTRTEKKKRNEISAYSVFNKNCHAIDGTLKAEQFEREIGCKVTV